MAKAQNKGKATPRQTGGAGFEFEDLSAAWLMVKMLRGVSLPKVDALEVAIKWQAEALGWKQIDDLLVICENTETKQLAVSCKSNMQVSGSGFPLDFIKNAWALGHGDGPFNKKRGKIACPENTAYRDKSNNSQAANKCIIGPHTISNNINKSAP